MECAQQVFWKCGSVRLCESGNQKIVAAGRDTKPWLGGFSTVGGDGFHDGARGHGGAGCGAPGLRHGEDGLMEGCFGEAERVALPAEIEGADEVVDLVVLLGPVNESQARGLLVVWIIGALQIGRAHV